jgi:oligopeptide transport system substrate-binding protein
MNNPYSNQDATQKIYYSSFPEPPKTLDPAKAYNVNESLFIEQIVEPLLEYHYFKRPYELIPLLAAQMPEITYWGKEGQQVTDPNQQEVAFTTYRIHIKPGILYQSHPAFARCGDKLCYADDNANTWSHLAIQSLDDFELKGTRSLIVDDFIYQIKRLADPHINSPIYGLMEDYIVGFKELNKQLAALSEKSWIDLRRYELAGVKKIDDLTFEIKIHGQYRPFLYWLAMHFFAPIPWEVDQFYAQPGMQKRNIGFDWNPVGTGPFLLKENNPNRRMVLERNPHFREVRYPSDGTTEDMQLGYLKNAGKRLPLIDKAVYTLEKEAIPRWNKFLQGYYDVSGVSSDSFDQAIHVNGIGDEELTPEMKAKQIRLVQTIDPSIYYFGFNMLDPIVGGTSERARLLRLAISLAINTEERIALFYNGRGESAQGPIPLGIFGHQVGSSSVNTLLYQNKITHLVRKPLSLARTWMRLAGYPNGIDPQTHRPLILNYDVAASGGPDEKAELEWMRKQFARLGISLNIRATQYNRFQEKMRTGSAQIYSWGWKADYPDPENFLFLLYGPNGEVKTGGENASNYTNPMFDDLFRLMKNRENDKQRGELIDKMIQLLQHDAPWIWGLYSKTLTLSQQWISPLKPNTMMMNALKYVSVDVPLRNQKRREWNQVVVWPLWFAGLGLIIFMCPLVWVYRRQERRSVRRFKE